MPAKRTSLRLISAAECPMLDEGDRIVLEGYEVLKRSSSRICGKALACILTEMTSGESPAVGTEFSCTGDGCKGVFVVEDATTATAVHDLTRDDTGTDDDAPFLSRIPVELVKKLIDRSEVLRYDKTTVIIREGEVGKSLYFVGDGDVEVVKEGESTDVVLATLAKGACFGEMSLLTGEPTSATVRANGSAAIFAMAGDVLDKMLSEEPTLAKEFSKLLASRLKATSGSLERELDRGILGRLSMISAVDLIQTLSASRRTGTLSLTHGNNKCLLYFLEGEIRGAVMGDVEGEEAFFPLLEWPDGDFCFEQSEPLDEVPGPLGIGTTALLMEGLRRIDERGRPDGEGGRGPDEALSCGPALQPARAPVEQDPRRGPRSQAPRLGGNPAPGRPPG